MAKMVILDKDCNGFEVEVELYYFSLHNNVIITAPMRLDGTWKAYVHVVDGVSHSREAVEAYRRGNGNQMMECYARPFFPELDKVKYA